MTEPTAEDILKSAILLEKRGRAFYTKVAKQTEHEGVREFFEMMADEEKTPTSSSRSTARARRCGAGRPTAS